MTEISFPGLLVQCKTGHEQFRSGETRLPFTLLDFWKWSASDLVSNAPRGCLAEFLVAQALGIVDGLRVEWDACDLRIPDGLTVEVKSAAYVHGPKRGRDYGPKRGRD